MADVLATHRGTWQLRCFVRRTTTKAQRIMKRGLEIGPGDSPLKSNGMICWDTMASSTMSEVKSFELTVDFHDVVWGCNSIPVAADYYDEIYASHVIEHVDWRLV